MKAGSKRVAQVLSERKEDLIAVINNGGRMMTAPLEVTPLSSVRFLMEVNYVGPFSVVKHFLPLLRKAKKGSARVINVSSVAGRISPPLLSAYTASKFALESLCNCLRTELKHLDIKTVCIQPVT